MQRNKIMVWSLGAVIHLLFSGVEPWENVKNCNTIIDLICFSKNSVPYLKIPVFPISVNIKNVDIRILLRLCMERNQLKRIHFQTLITYILNYFTKKIFSDNNLDETLKTKTGGKKGNLLIKNRAYYLEKNILFPCDFSL